MGWTMEGNAIQTDSFVGYLQEDEHQLYVLEMFTVDFY
jgi:hypothetical protein